MKYAYEDLSDTQFERLVELLCQELLGMAAQGFAPGPDKGRDAKFVGTANLIPSKSSPWSGTTVIQAKHSNGFNRSFSETDFFSENSDKTILGKEIPRIKALRTAGQLDNYILFSNRRLTSGTETIIREYIATECGLPEQNLFFCDVNKLELWLKKFHWIPAEADLDPVDSPLIVSSDDLAEVVEALARQKSVISDIIDDPPTPRTPYEEKNQINNMTVDYAKALRNRYLKDTAQISAFLAAPENFHLMRAYESAVDEFQMKILAKRKDYQTFDEILEYLADLLFARDAVLRQHGKKRLTKALLFYMYWHCDIGKDSDAETD